ncbi:hypothetical protein RclHR1_10990003 [Rhizophagus clarus]|uniref:Uncharacterized protein n=1 Tax=Rhizophagus clarus TaxID=94130 RepID=A0A2Z6Q7L6_9GLOM|nr:hypothetical protein RclHR1_10990003 [Rhizophagus clarus]
MKYIAKSFYFNIKTLLSNGQTFKYWNTIKGHASDIGIIKRLKDLEEENGYYEEIDSNSDDVDSVAEYDHNDFTKLVDQFRSFLFTNYNIVDEIARIIFENSDKLNCKLSQNHDLLCNGIVFKELLSLNHPTIYKILKKVKMISQLDSPNIILKDQNISLISELLKYSSIPTSFSFKREDFAILKLIEKFNYIWKSSSYQIKSNISEKTYSNDIAFPIVNFSLKDITNIERKYDGTICQSSKCRNGGSYDGPTKFPDFLAYYENQKHGHFYEFFFCEVSYGPFTYNESHTKDDFTKLFKFSADSLNHDFLFLSGFEDFNEIFNHYKQIKICLFHFYDTKLDIYFVD